MAAATLTSVVLRYIFFGIILFTIITAISETVVPLTTYGNYESQAKGDDGRLKVESAEIVADYGYWNPNPMFGGGKAGPIHH